MEIEDDEILQGFIEESLEHLLDIEHDLLVIEEAGENCDEDLVNKVFRAAHSIKGGAGFLGLYGIQGLSHAMENILGIIRRKRLIPNPDIVNVLLLAADQLLKMIENIHSSNDVDITEHLSSLNAIVEGVDSLAEPALGKSLEMATEPIEKTQPEPDMEAEPTSEILLEPELVPGSEFQREACSELEFEDEQDFKDVPEQQAMHAGAVAKKITLSKDEYCSTAQAADAGSPQKVETTIRVHVSLFDQLMTLAGELVLSRNQLLQTIGSEGICSAEAVGQRIDLITSEIQEAVMLTRMQPIGNVFSKFPRVVRDLAGKLNKTIDLKTFGKDVELDKTIIEAINDPLTHLVRNSVDHGIELPAERTRAGKPEVGLITLKAYHEAGQVVIEISDDGKGLDGDTLAASAIHKGLITVEQAQIMSDKEKINLIFLPGFSTAKEVTDVSGRGVGMDVVKTNLDRLGGNIDILSKVGGGTTIFIKLPLTLAIIPCQIILMGGERYAIPQVNLEELLRIPASQVKERVERVGNAEVVRLRGNLLPLIRLADVLGVQRTFWDQTDNTPKCDRRAMISDRRSLSSPGFHDEVRAAQVVDSNNETMPQREGKDRRTSPASALNIVVVSTGAMKYGLIVDRLQDSEEIVIKPLGRHLHHCKGYAGATIMGDGRIALILDVGNLARMARLTSIEGTDRAHELAFAQEEAKRAQKDKQALLVFRNSEKEHFAVPLNQVERIEKIKRSDVEELGGKRVMQYREGSLSLICIEDVASVHTLADHDDLLVLVFKIASRLVGLLAIGPIDAIEISCEIDGVTLRQPGIIGSTIIGKQTTLLVDVFELVQVLFPEWIEDTDAFQINKGSADTPPTILIAEDSNFFRNQVKGYLMEAGYNVLEGEDGQIAWDLLLQNADLVSMVVTDIEMPNMDGFELTQTIRNDPHFAKLPVIALTTLAGEEDVAKGKAAGVDEYQIKLDKKGLMACVHDYMKRIQ